MVNYVESMLPGDAVLINLKKNLASQDEKEILDGDEVSNEKSSRLKLSNLIQHL